MKDGSWFSLAWEYDKERDRLIIYTPDSVMHVDHVDDLSKLAEDYSFPNVLTGGH